MKVKRRAVRQLVAIVAVLVIAVMTTVTVNVFIRRVRNNETAIADNNLLVAANNGAAIVRTTFENYIKNLQTAALIVEKMGDMRGEKTQSLLREIAAINGYERMAVDFPEGRCYTMNGDVLDTQWEGNSERIVNGEIFISDVTESRTDGKPIVSFFVPLRDAQGQPCAALRLAMSTESLAKAIDLTLFDSEGYYHLIDENGRYVSVGESQNALLMDVNFFDAIAAMSYNKGFSEKDILSSFTQGKSTYSKYSVDGHERLAYCEPVGINKWVMMTIVPREAVARLEHQNVVFAARLTIGLAIIMTIIFIFIFWQQQRAHNMAMLNDRCFRALAQQSGKVIFEWDFAKNKITPMANYRLLFGKDFDGLDLVKEIEKPETIHPDDRELFGELLDRLRGGGDAENVRLRVEVGNGQYLWCAISCVVVLDRQNRPYKAIGSLEDVDALVKSEVSLKKRLENDPLTGLYNRSTTELMIKDRISAKPYHSRKGALMIIDIDNFKDVNDTLGHQHGDRVLAELAKALGPLAGTEDILGRLGGDEFFLFLSGCNGQGEVEQKAKNICDIFRTTCAEEGASCNISASIGIAFYPEHSDSFEMLYRYADIALYHTKRKGKDGYTVYSNALGMGMGMGYVSNRTEIDQRNGASK